ncbi:MAG: glycoside hydrolase family 9 protein [Bacteroidota bacterium]
MKKYDRWKVLSRNGWILAFFFCLQKTDAQIHVRINQLGYAEEDRKVAILISPQPVRGRVALLDADNRQSIFSTRLGDPLPNPWGDFSYYQIDFSACTRPGSYKLSLSKGQAESITFNIGHAEYKDYQEDLMAFMRQQRCGYNPFLDMVCHQRDGRSMYGPMPDSSYVDASGGWHDAGDQLKYLITGSNATARMLLSYELYPDQFADLTNEWGQEGQNGIPDVLDEAKWGLDWLHKLHPSPDQLIHQIADDRDHRGWKMPDEDISDYGWGANSYRVAYFATGTPQGLGAYKSQATGVANLAGRSAAAMALGYRMWRDVVKDSVYANQCLRAAKSLYALGKEKEGFQQGNSYSAPYRYGEDTWTDDMEWGAAELFRATGDSSYLSDAIRYAKLTNTQTSWMSEDTALHYRFYPFVNVGHFALHRVAPSDVQKELEQYYRTGIEMCQDRAKGNPFQVGVPFIWCSNNLVSALITQIILYERMSGDLSYHSLMLAQRDWLFGTNPWGTSMFTQIPRTGEYPLDVHTSVWMKTQREVPGGLIDGPLRQDIHDNQLGIAYTEPDEFAEVQNGAVAYHDDNGDYATNEPTMDGTADAILMMADWSQGRWKRDHGAIVRGDERQKELALVFTGDEFADGGTLIQSVLDQHDVSASFFLTGNFYRNPQFANLIKELKKDGHYLGAHSDRHLLYCDWSKRDSLLVNRAEFVEDLEANYAEMKRFRIKRTDAPFFLPPYEWYNDSISAWTASAELQLVNMTPGTRSHADYTTPEMTAYIGSEEIFESITRYEQSHDTGLNGFMLLMHVGTAPERTDKFYHQLDNLIQWLKQEGYQLKRVDEVLR